MFPRPAGPCLCGYSSSSSQFFDLSFFCRISEGTFRPRDTYFGPGSSFRAMVFPRPAGPCLCGYSSSSSQFFDLSFIVGFQKGRSGPGTRILDSVRPLGPWCFPVRQGRVFVVTAACYSSSSSQLFDLSFIVGLSNDVPAPGHVFWTRFVL